MAKTNAEYQREHRERRADRIAELECALADRDADLAAARATIARLERERERLYVLLAEASAEPGRLADSHSSSVRTPDCPHPAASVIGDRCGACGQVLDSW
jgi:chromosome segregation ATPase